MKLALVAAVARNGVIGRDNKLLWRLKTDLRRFKELTTGRPLIMGRKTFDSIGRPLPNRLNIVVSRRWSEAVQGIACAESVDEAIAIAKRELTSDASSLLLSKGGDWILIAGGGEIYSQTIDRASRLFITEVDLEPEGDAFFPEIDPKLWREVSRKAFPKGPDDEAAFSFVDYVRR